jgi:hypothetical protein
VAVGITAGIGIIELTGAATQNIASVAGTATTGLHAGIHSRTDKGRARTWMSVGLCRYVMLERSIFIEAMTAACETGIYCWRKYYFRTDPCSGCLRLLIVVEPAAQQIHGGFPNLGLRFPLRVTPRASVTRCSAIWACKVTRLICHDFGLWLHVDGAYGGMAAIVPEMRHVLDGCTCAIRMPCSAHSASCRNI